VIGSGGEISAAKSPECNFRQGPEKRGDLSRKRYFFLPIVGRGRERGIKSPAWRRNARGKSHRKPFRPAMRERKQANQDLHGKKAREEERNGRRGPQERLFRTQRSPCKGKSKGGVRGEEEFSGEGSYVTGKFSGKCTRRTGGREHSPNHEKTLLKKISGWQVLKGENGQRVGKASRPIYFTCGNGGFRIIFSHRKGGKLPEGTGGVPCAFQAKGGPRRGRRQDHHRGGIRYEAGTYRKKTQPIKREEKPDKVYEHISEHREGQNHLRRRRGSDEKRIHLPAEKGTA